jgi:hypothetical protein
MIALLDSRGSGQALADGTVYLLPYYMGCITGLLSRSEFGAER